MKLARLKNILACRNEEGQKKRGEFYFITSMNRLCNLDTNVLYWLTMSWVGTKRKKKLALQLTINVR